MAYIGNQPFTTAFLTDQFSGNGSTTAFTLSAAPANTNSIIVAVSGVLQDPSTYSVSGTTLTFSAAPPSGTGNISVRFLGIPASGVTTTAYRTVTEFTATAGQTTFTPPSYTVGYINVYRNGALLGTADYTATNGTTVVLASAASSGDLVVVESFYVSSVLNAIPATANAVIDNYILSMAGSKLTGSQVIPKATLPTGSVLQVVSTTKTDTFTMTGQTQTAITGLTATITPTSATSKILIILSIGGFAQGTGQGRFILQRNSSDISGAQGASAGSRLSDTFTISGPTSGAPQIVGGIHYLDSPASTSALTYGVTVSSNDSGQLIYINRSNADTDNSSHQRNISTITVMEIAA